jgi:hypothetical protein
MRRYVAAGAVAVLLVGCIDAQPLSPDFEQRVFSILGGLEVGEALTLFGESAESIVLQGGAAGARYVFVPFLAAEQGSVRLRIDVRGEQIETVDASQPSLVAESVATRGGAEPYRNSEEHLRLRQWELQAAAGLLGGGGARIRRALAADPGFAAQVEPPTVGETVQLRVINRDPANPDLCANPKERTGRITAVTDHAILVEDTRNPLALPPSDVQRIADEYEQLVHPVAVENFGEPTDVDGNGRVYIFMTSAINETANRSGGGITVGFTFALDLLPREGSGGGQGCAASNEGEIFYLIAPDPSAVLGVPVSEELVRRLTTAIVVHELQHMISFGRRLYEVEDAREFEELWLNEGLSHIAEELVFYAATGLRPRSEIDWETLSGAEAPFNAYSRFIRSNMSIYSEYLQSPDNESLMGKSPSDDDFETRGATWAFLRYLADQTPTADAALFYALVNSPVAGLSNLERVLETDPLTWMQRWTVSNYTENLAPQESVDARFTQPSWDFRSIFEGETGTVPLTPHVLQPDGTVSLNLRGGGSAYVVLRAMPGRQARLNTTRSPAPVFGELRASVVRIE